MRGNRGPKALLLAALTLALTGCGKDEPEPLPTEYAVGGESVAAFAPGEGATLTQAEDSTAVYTYGGVSDPGQAAKTYMDQLTDGDFTVVDELFNQSDEPDFTTPQGTVQLAKNAREGGRVLFVQLVWNEDGCTITVAAPEGEVDLSEPKTMTLLEAEDHFKRLSPAQLGLEGDSMDEYQVYSLSGVVLVDDQPCLQLSVYSNDNPEQTNDLMGRYLMTSDGSHIYRLDEVGQEVKEMDQDAPE